MVVFILDVISIFEVVLCLLGQAVRVPVVLRLGGQLAMTVVATKNIIISSPPPFFPSAATYSHRRSARMKKLILQKLAGGPNSFNSN